MAPITRRLLRIKRRVSAIDDRASKNRNIDADCCMPNKDLQPRRQALLNKRLTDRISDRFDDHATSHVQIAPFNRPERYLVSLDDFAKSMDDRFCARIPGCKSI